MSTYSHPTERMLTHQNIFCYCAHTNQLVRIQNLLTIYEHTLLDHVNAVSGRGLVRNYANIVPEWTLETLYDYTMMGVPEQDANTERWDFERFHPQVVVVFVGINDFQGEPPYADVGKFKQAYVKLLDRLRALHPGVKFLLVATKTWPNDDLGGVVEGIYNDQVAAGKTDILYKFVYTENTALHGHPSENSQKELANTLRPLVARLGGWLSR